MLLGLPMRFTAVIVGVLFLQWAYSVRACADSPILFTDVSDTTGIDFTHYDGSDGRYFIIESMSAGLALLDYDNDSDLDIYFLNGAAIEGPIPDKVPRNALYRNDGNFRFVDVTAEANVGDSGFGLGVGCADFNNDGFTDLYINNYGRNTLLQNNADGTFTDVTVHAGVGNGQEVGGGVSFFDMDLDGNLDLYVANYIQFDAQRHQVHIHKGLPSYPSPLGYIPAGDTLLRNAGDGTFADVSQVSGIREVAGRSMGVATFDYDSDGDFDVYVANDSQENHLFANDGSGHFTESAFLNGVAFDFRGKGQASMGVEVGDLDEDGLLDLVVTSFSEEFVTCYRNAGGGFFDDVTLRTGIGPPTFPHVTWGLVVEDFDLDGRLDLMIGAGDLDDNRSQRGGKSASSGYEIPDLLFHNASGGKLDPLTDFWRGKPAASRSTRGLIAGDLDGDGDADIVALNTRRQPTILRNDSPHEATCILRLVGTQSNRDAIGTRVAFSSQDGLVAARYVNSGRSYQSDARIPISTPIPHSQQVSIDVTWPSGLTFSTKWNPSQPRIIEIRESRA